MKLISRANAVALLLLGGCSLPDLGPQGGAIDVELRQSSPRTSYVMDVAEDGDRLILSLRPASPIAAGPSDAAGTMTDVPPGQDAAPDQDRVLAPCREGAGDWYRHTPLGYVCVGEPASSENLSAALP
jgi:hypothetical protein